MITAACMIIPTNMGSVVYLNFCMTLVGPFKRVSLAYTNCNLESFLSDAQDSQSF